MQTKRPIGMVRMQDRQERRFSQTSQQLSAMAKHKYWCLLADALPESADVSATPILTSPIEFVKARRKSDLIVLGRCDEKNKVGHVSALGS